MGEPPDLTGRVYGRLTVIAREGSRPHGLGTQRAWRCRCTCGGEKIVRGDNLRHGYTRSCGCLRLGRQRPTSTPRIEEHW